MVMRSSDVFNSDIYKPLSFVLNVFSLKCAEEKTTNGVLLWFLKAIITSIFLSCIQIYCFFNYYYEVILDKNEHSDNINHFEITQTIFSHVQYHVDLYFVYKYGRHTKFEYLKGFLNIDNIVDFSKNINCNVKNSNKLYCLSFLIAWFISSATDIVTWTLSNSVYFVIYAPLYFYPLINMATLLDFIFQILLVECCLKTIADILQRHEKQCFSKKKVNNWLDRSITSLEKTSLDRLKILSSNLNEDILHLKYSYILLLKQSAYINKMYGFRILLNSASSLIDMVYFATIAYKCIIGTFKFRDQSLVIVSSILSFTKGPLVLISLIYRCEQCYRQNENILSILDELMATADFDAVPKQVVGEFLNLVQSRAITFHAANFFKIDYKLLVSIASACVTYTIILC